MTAPGLWGFALDLYRRPGVEAACLRLQDEAGADVPFVLFLLWCGATGRPLDAAAVVRAEEGIAVWRREVIRPLRNVRRAMKAGLLQGRDTEALRGSVKAAELAAERLELEALEGAAPATADGLDNSALARAHLDLCRTRLGRDLPADAVAALLGALDAA